MPVAVVSNLEGRPEKHGENTVPDVSNLTPQETLSIELDHVSAHTIDRRLERLDQAGTVICRSSALKYHMNTPLVDAIDLHLFDRGFVRVSARSPSANPENDLVYMRSSAIDDLSILRAPRRHKVTMPDLGQNGRFANQLFQYVFVALYGLRSNCEIIVPQFEGHDFFDLPFQATASTPLPRLNFLNNHGDAALVLEASYPPRNVEVCGYFQHITAAHQKHERLIRHILRPKPAIETALKDWNREIRERFKRVIGLHIRRGDYSAYNGGVWWRFSQVPTAWYADWLKAHGGIGADDGLFIATDDPSVRAAFASYKIVQNEVPPPASIDLRMADLFGLAQCDTALYCNSSWSFSAALLAPPSQEAFLASFEERTFKRFNPWAGEDFWLQFEGGSRNIQDMPLRSCSRAEAEQKLLDRWRCQAELAFCLRNPLRYALRLASDRLLSSDTLKAVISLWSTKGFSAKWSQLHHKAHEHRRQIRALMNGRGRITCESLDLLR